MVRTQSWDKGSTEILSESSDAGQKFFKVIQPASEEFEFFSEKKHQSRKPISLSLIGGSDTRGWESVYLIHTSPIRIVGWAEEAHSSIPMGYYGLFLTLRLNNLASKELTKIETLCLNFWRWQMN